MEGKFTYYNRKRHTAWLLPAYFLVGGCYLMYLAFMLTGWPATIRATIGLLMLVVGAFTSIYFYKTAVKHIIRLDMEEFQFPRININDNYRPSVPIFGEKYVVFPYNLLRAVEVEEHESKKYAKVVFNTSEPYYQRFYAEWFDSMEAFQEFIHVVEVRCRMNRAREEQ